MPDPTDIHTELARVKLRVVDAAAPYADMPPNVHLAAFGRPYSGSDWRFEVTWPGGAETCFHAGATADDVATVVKARAGGHHA